MSDHALRSAAALSYYAIFSLVPLLLLITAIAGFIFEDRHAVETVVSQATRVAGVEVGRTVDSLLSTVREQRGGTLFLGLALAAFSASGVLQQAQAVLAEIFRVPPARRRAGLRGWIVKRAIAVGVSLGVALLILTPIAAALAVDGLASLLPQHMSWLSSVLRLAVPVLSGCVLILMTALTFQTLTPVKVPWRAAWRGGAATAPLAIGSAFLVGIYLSRLGGAGALGVLGGAAILLFFFFAMWGVYLFGAEVTKVYAARLDAATYTESPLPRTTEAPPRQQAPPPTNARAPRRHLGFLAGLAVGWLAAKRSGRKGPARP